MAHFERIRDVISGPFDSEVIRQRTAAGWQLVSIEWRRELPESESATQGAFNEDIPYGLRISDDCQRLEVDPVENRTLMLPRLIEVGPRLFETEEWQKLRQRFSLSRAPEAF